MYSPLAPRALNASRPLLKVSVHSEKLSCTLLPPRGSFAKILTTEPLELNLCGIWTSLKYWYWLGAEELSRGVEGRGGSWEEVTG